MAFRVFGQIEVIVFCVDKQRIILSQYDREVAKIIQSTDIGAVFVINGTADNSCLATVVNQDTGAVVGDDVIEDRRTCVFVTKIPIPQP